MTNVVLVTGGNGFLGQHVIKHLHLYGDNVREIRVFDMVEYRQKLDFEPQKPVQKFIGSITDGKAVSSALKGVDVVIHLASVVDPSQFPNTELLHQVNCIGTEVVLSACRQQSVEYCIYCGSSSVYLGPQEVVNGTESTVKRTNNMYYSAYGKSKAYAQDLVLSANGSKLQNGKLLYTLTIIPIPMFGEQDYLSIPNIIKPFIGGTFPRVGKMDATLQYSYVGNTAHMFLRAAEVLPKRPSLGGQFFFATDDTPTGPMLDILKPFLDEYSVRPSTWHIPYPLVHGILFLFFCVFVILRHLPIKTPDVKFSHGSIAFMNTTFTLTYDKAKSLLGYKPLYNNQTAMNSSLQFYKTIL